MLTENEVSRTWQSLFKNKKAVTAETFEKAETLLDELRTESPLWHRLNSELQELRKMCLAGK